MRLEIRNGGKDLIWYSETQAERALLTNYIGQTDKSKIFKVIISERELSERHFENWYIGITKTRKKQK